MVTGAASGIGKAIALELARLQWHVIACDIDETNLAKLKSLPYITTLHLDVRSTSSTKGLQTEVARLFPDGLDALVNAAGVNVPAPLIANHMRYIERTMSVNCMGPVRVANALMSSLLKGDNVGYLVNISSTCGMSGGAWPFTSAYSMSKAGLEAATDSIRREAMANELPLRVVLIQPGPVDTPMAQLAPSKALSWCEKNRDSPWEPAMRRSASRADTMMKRHGLGVSSFRLGYRADEVCDICVEALSTDHPRARYIAARGPFLWLARLAGWLPTELGDILMKDV